MKSILPSPLSLIGSCIPLFGVLFFGWDLFGVLFAYAAQQSIFAFFMCVKYIFLNPEMQGNKRRWFYIFIAAFIFAMMLLGILMSALDILSGSHGIPRDQILSILRSVTSTPLRSLALSFLYFLVVATYDFYKQLPQIKKEAYVWQVYGIALGRVISIVILLGIMGLLVTKANISLQIGTVVLLVLSVFFDSFWASSRAFRLMSL